MRVVSDGGRGSEDSVAREGAGGARLSFGGGPPRAEDSAPGARRVALPTYEVLIARGALARLGDLARAAAPAHRYAIVTDDNVAPLHAARAARALGVSENDVLVVPAGERHKTRESWARLTDELLARGFGRDSALVALGGGVVGDLAGFVAATFMRGIPYVQVPTTLLAMVDSSVGGKTGVDTPAGKNLVGAFHQPAAVVADPLLLATLPREQLRAGFAEVLKHGVIADAAYLDAVVAELPALLAPDGGEREVMVEAIARSVEIKADVVRRDEREGGVRKILNFGHTLGHAVEALSGFALLHGEAVAVGMALESRLAERAAIAAPGLADRVEAALARAGLPTRIAPGLSPAITPERIVEATHGDKKARAGQAEYALPRAIGQMAGADRGWGIRVSDALVLELLRETLAS